MLVIEVLMEISNFRLDQCAWLILVFVSMFLAWQSFSAWAQIPKELAVNSDYKNLTVKELMNIEVISATKFAGIEIPRSFYGRATWRY